MIFSDFAHAKDKWIAFFVLKLMYSPSQQCFSHVGTEPGLSGFNQYCKELMCLAQGHNSVPLVGIEPRTYRFGVRCCTTMSSRSLERLHLMLLSHCK